MVHEHASLEKENGNIIYFKELQFFAIFQVYQLKKGTGRLFALI